ncbi:MAG: hypothetical protein ACWGQW_09020 [bacterium]
MNGIVRFKRNTLYTVWWEDAYSTSSSQHKAGDPVIQITHGVMVKTTKKMVVLATTHTEDPNAEWARDETGILRSNITQVKEWGRCPEIKAQ